MRNDPSIDRALSDASIETVLLPKVPEVKLFLTLEEIDQRYTGNFNIPSHVEIDLYGACIAELHRRGVKRMDRYEHNLHRYCGAKKCERI